MRIEDGCATETGYNLPSATGFFMEPGRREKGLKPGSQDISLVTLVGPELFPANFSVKEKDEASPGNCFPWDVNAFILCFAGVWRFFIFRLRDWSLKPVPPTGTTLKDQS